MSDISACSGKFVWHDLMCADVKAALPFYSALFPEWRIQEMDMGGGIIYRMIHVGDRQIGGFVPLDPAHGMPSHWIGYVAVADCDATIAKFERLGGKALAPAFSVPEIGRFAFVRDPQGAAINLFQLEKPLPLPELPAIGRVCWNELLTTHINEARKFYVEIFGWVTSDIDMGPMGTYTVFQLAGKDNCGGMNMPPGVEAPPHWMHYFFVDSVDARTEKATSLGAKVCAPPADIPGIGRFSVVADPIGAVFALFQPPQE